jgi:NTP pyrophosphatase (non-canonical NTP hydrolase)
MNKIDLSLYSNFVEQVTSDNSNNTASFVKTVNKLESDSDTKVSLLLTGAIGMSSEAGEFNEIVKKCLFQGKPFTDETKFHLSRELGDIIWYWINSCRALNLDPNDVIAENVKKLESRYPGGSFSVAFSETRQEGDI